VQPKRMRGVGRSMLYLAPALMGKARKPDR
jgi:hypothetical protein